MKLKRTAASLIMLAGLGGAGCVSPASQSQQQQQPTGGYGTVTRGKQVDGYQGPGGEPIMAVRGAAPSGGVKQAGGTNTLVGDTGFVRPASHMNPNYVNPGDGSTGVRVPGVGGNLIRAGGPMPGGMGPMGPMGPMPGHMMDPSMAMGGPKHYRPNPQMPAMPHTGILPVPSMGPPGATAGAFAMTPGMAMRSPAMQGRTSINFTAPAGMKVTWQLPDGTFNDEASGLTVPKEYNFVQGQVYRLRLTQVLPDHPGKAFYPTLEVYPMTPKTMVFLSHASVPITFAADDFAQARAGNLVVKVVYLPDPANQEFSTVVGAEEVVSTRLEPGADPIAEAQRRGTILAVVRMGNIDLENRIAPAMTAPPPGAAVPVVPVVPVPPGGLLPKANGMEPLAPFPPGAATVSPPSALPPLPPSAPTDLPVPPVAPMPKPVK